MDKKVGCLIIHGFGGSISEIAPLSEYLSKRGFVTVCPELKGHTGKRSDLVNVKYSEWIKSAEKGLITLQSKCKYVVVIGFSMGGLIAVNLSLKYKISAVVTLNMPIFYWDFKRIALNIKDDFRNKRYYHTKRYLKSSTDKPLSSLINFKVLLEKTKPLIKEVKYPLFIVQALEDDTVQHQSAEYIYLNAQSSDKSIKYYEGSGHIICHSSIADKVFEDIVEFIDKRL